MDTLLLQAVEGMKKNGFEVVQVNTAAEAKEYLLSQIDQSQSVGIGGSVSVQSIGIVPALQQKGCAVYTTVGAAAGQVKQIRLQARMADGNRVGAVCDGPEHLYFVISHSKVVDGGINTAIARIKQTACPQNTRRLGLDTPCSRTGKCGGDECGDRTICCLTLSVDHVPHDRKITVVFVEETLGY